MTYTWKDGSFIKADAQIVGQYIDLLQKENGGAITPVLLLKDAKRKASPLHNLFEWDDSRAAEQYRLSQAGYIVRHLEIVQLPADGKHTEARTIRAFVSVVQDDGPVYTTLHNAMQDDEMRRQVLQRAWNELKAWENKYAALTELAAVFSAVKKTAARVERVLNVAEEVVQ